MVEQDNANNGAAADMSPMPGPDNLSEVIVITGMSGAGRTEAMHAFEDLGYFCIDNLPPSLLMNLVALAGLQEGSLKHLAVVCDLRTKEFFPKLMQELNHLDEVGISHMMIFLDASDESLVKRYQASRRRHPLCDKGMRLTTGIAKEREMLAEAREKANYVIDTSRVRPQRLREQIRQLVTGADSVHLPMSVTVFSFGFKHGTPTDADIVMDVRFLPNPYWEDELRSRTGLDPEVRDYVLKKKVTKQFMKVWEELLDVVMPQYVKEGKQQLTIAIGCTGGQHRSVVVATEAGRYLEQGGYSVAVTHRDLPLAQVKL